ncbi:hypothetical protein NFI96_007352 [Prochilodus magdalenae]|nr:hypothetical protein NFI96_007352 [Prochilodus magdalenae]
MTKRKQSFYVKSLTKTPNTWEIILDIAAPIVMILAVYTMMAFIRKKVPVENDIIDKVPAIEPKTHFDQFVPNLTEEPSDTFTEKNLERSAVIWKMLRDLMNKKTEVITTAAVGDGAGLSIKINNDMATQHQILNSNEVDHGEHPDELHHCVVHCEDIYDEMSEENIAKTYPQTPHTPVIPCSNIRKEILEYPSQNPPVKMPPKASKQPKESLQSATGMEVSISREASQATSDEDLPPVWEKVSNKILKTINERFDKFELSFQTLQTTLQTVTEKMNVAEEQIQEHEVRISSLETALAETQRKNELLRLKLDDLEGRSRRNNIKIVGVPEGEEKGKPTEFVTGLLPKLLGATHFAEPLIVDRAHCVLQPKPPEGAKPRTIIARVHFYTEKERILQLRAGRNLDYNGHKVYIFPDYTAEVLSQRRSFRDVMQALRALQLPEFCKVELDAPILEIELMEAIQAFPSGKSPGPDGFGTSFCEEKMSLSTLKMNTGETKNDSKKIAVTELNNHRTDALMSVIKKSFECLVLAHLKNITGHLLDGLQFAYRANRTVKRAVNVGLHYIFQYLKIKCKSCTE